MWEALIAVVALTAMEIVLGIDNIVFIAIVSARLPEEQRPAARKLGLLGALVTRILLLFTLTWIMQLDKPFFVWSSWIGSNEFLEHHESFNGVSVKDLILLVGGLFLIWHSVGEIHEKLDEQSGHEEDEDGDDQPEVTPTMMSIVIKIMLLDVIFSLDSVITAVGMVKSQWAIFGMEFSGIWLMVSAVILSIIVMIIFANPISEFVEKYPTIKMLALSFLILIGVMLVAEGAGTHFDKGYVYFAMVFALIVEFLNMRMRIKSPRGEELRRNRRKKTAAAGESA